MAVLAIAAIGAGLGSTVGLTSVGWLVGSLIGNMLFGPKPPSTTVEGPRLGDLTVTSSTYGAPIPYAYGTARLAGNIIWSSGIREQKNVTSQRSGGGKGGGKKATQTTITYTYFCSFAVCFGEGEADGIIRIWADSKLIYDAGSGTDVSSNMEGLIFRFYPGDEIQTPDGIIVADKGDNNVPAFRGLTYIVIDNLPLANFGNRIPNITAEVAFKQATPTFPVLTWTPINSAVAGTSTSGASMAADPNRGIIYTGKFTGSTGTLALRRMQYNSLNEDRVVLDSDIFVDSAVADFSAFSNFFCGRDGYIYGNGTGGNSKKIVRVDPNSFKEVSHFGSSSSGTSNTPVRFPALGNMGMASAYGPNGRVDFLITGGFFNQVGVLNAATMTYVWGDGKSTDEPRLLGIVSGDIYDGQGTAYVIGGGTTGGPGTSATIGIYKFTIDAIAAYDATYSLVSTGVQWEKLATLNAADVIPTASFVAGGVCLGRDPSDGGLLIATTDDAGAHSTMFKWTEADGIVWKTEVPDFYNDTVSGIPSLNRMNGVNYSWIGGTGTTPRTIDLRTGELTIGTSIVGLGASYPQMFDATSNSILFRSGTGVWKKVFLGRAAAEGDQLGDIVVDICRRVGLGEADLDVSELTDIVPGFVVGRPGSARDALEPLTQAFFFDGVESDYLLKFVKRGVESALTIPQSELGYVDDETGECWRESRTQEVELPERVNVIYMEQDNDYQQMTQFEKRVALPNPTMSSKNQTNLELPIVLNADIAKQIAQKWLFTSWIERVSYESILSWRYLFLDPTDVVTIELDNGNTFLSRLVKSDIGANLAISTNWIAQDAASYDSTAVGSQGSGFPVQVPPGSAFTRLFLLDIPLLRDVDDTGGISSRAYYFQGGFGQTGWPGALLYKSQDNVSFLEAGESVTEVAWGTIPTALPAPTSPFGTDEINTLDVFMTTGADRLESVTTLEMLNGANAALIINSTGQPEVIQFRDVLENDDGSYTLSYLLRGRRGTDTFCGGHVNGETFILLETDTAEAVLLGLAELNAVRYYKGVGFGTLFENADLETRTNTGRDLKPYAPVNAKATIVSADLVLTWDRRTRMNGQLLDSVGDVPLNEATESYSIDIYNGASIVRTLTATSETVTYTGANITTDLGGIPATLKFAVYQISAVVGRGFGYIKTVDVTS
jgi:hypothetical protein